MKHTTKQLCLTALLCAFTAVVSKLSIPIPGLSAPLTLQIFAVSLCGYLLGPIRGIICIFLYILLGICGVPVFSGFGTGFGALLGPTGGFILSFPLLAFICGISSRINKKSKILLDISGLIICHLCGIFYYMYIGGCAFGVAATAVSLPYIVKDFLLLLGAQLTVKKIKKVL